jgi:hypothetical protein
MILQAIHTNTILAKAKNGRKQEYYHHTIGYLLEVQATMSLLLEESYQHAQKTGALLHANKKARLHALREMFFTLYHIIEELSRLVGYDAKKLETHIQQYTQPVLATLHTSP